VPNLDPDNLSAAVADALRQWSARARLGRMLDALDAIHGPVPTDVAAEVEAKWDPIFDRSEARRVAGPKP
jgi:phage baseplate assembly protein W